MIKQLLKNWKPIHLCWWFKKKGWKIPKYLSWLIGNPATIFEDNFNSYNDGDLNTQGDWSGDTNFDISAGSAYEGAKGVVAERAAIGWIFIEKTGTGRTEGQITWYMKLADAGNARVDFRLYDGGNYLTKILFTADKWYYHSSAAQAEGGAILDDTWYVCQMKWREDAGNPLVNWRVYAASGAPSAWVGETDPYADWGVGGLDTLSFGHFGAATGETKGYWDYIAEEPYAPAPESVKIEKSSKYSVVTTPSAKTKGLIYDVQTADSITKSLKYSVETTPTKITKQLKYNILILPSVTTQAVDNIEKTTAMGHGTIGS